MKSHVGRHGVLPYLAVIVAALALLPVAMAQTSTGELVLDNVVEALEVKNTSIEDVLRMLAEQNDLNLIIGPDSMGSVSLRFSGVTLRAALDVMLRAKGYQYQIFDNIMLVSQPDSLERRRGLGLETRLFRLENADARNIKSTIDTSRVLSPWGYTTVYTRSVNVEAAKAASIKPGLAFIQGERYSLIESTSGQVPLQTRSDVLLITDKPHILDRIAELIKFLDQPMRQISIEVKFVETNLDDQDTRGIDWSKLLQVQGSYSGRTTWKLGDQPFSFAPTSEGIVELGTFDNTRFDVILDMMLKSEKSKLLSQPSILTVDHQPATISVGTTYWIESREGSAATGDLKITYKERQIPIELIVVPHILTGDNMLLEIRPRVEEITGFQEGAGGLQLPLISSRAADARIEVPSGETAVIGGLLREKTINTESRLWLLSSIPLIGNLFRHNVKATQRTDLSIFITPLIIPAYGGGESGQSKVKSLGLEDAVKKPALPSARVESKPEPVEPPSNVITGIDTSPDAVDLGAYFPLNTGEHWGYSWRRADGDRWTSELTVASEGADLVTLSESTPSGPYPSQARTGYRWSDEGMVHVYRVAEGGDSVVFDPPRVVLPSKMSEGRIYQNSYRSVSWTGGERKRVGEEIVQEQRLLGKFTVNTSIGRFADCLAVETVWFPKDKPNADKNRKVVWYASNEGPVKVEHDIPEGSPTLKGSMSALLTAR